MAKVLLVVGGTLLILSGMAQGLMFGLTADGPPIQGHLGGLWPSASAMLGTVLIAWATLRE
jgi:hypothetical protein